MAFIEKRSGRYRARYRDPAGRLTSRTFTRKVDAERFVREMEVDISRGVWVDPRGADASVSAWAEEFLSLARRLAPSTQDTYRRDLEKYILPRFGSYRLGRLPAVEIENWPPRVPRREMVFLGWEQAVDLAEAHSDRYQALIYTAVDTGMRWSELVGLRRSRLDLAHGKVRVTEQLLRASSGDWIRKEPKTSASVRSISLSPFTAELLSEHVGKFSGSGPDGLVFANGADHPIAGSSFWNNHFSRALDRAEVRCRFHDLRHTSVALAIAEGAHPKAIQARMGHSSISHEANRPSTNPLMIWTHISSANSKNSKTMKSGSSRARTCSTIWV